MNRRMFLASVSSSALVAVVGCAPKAPYALVPISGTVTYKGKPLDDRFHIQFEPEDGTRSSMGKLDANGKFEAVHTTTQKGVKPGMCAVVVYWNDDATVNPVPEEFADMMAKYGFTGSDKLKIEITKKDKNFEVKYE